MLLLPTTALAGPFLQQAAGMLSPCDGTRRDAVTRMEICTEVLLTCCCLRLAEGTRPCVWLTPVAHLLMRIGCLDSQHPGNFLAISLTWQAELGDKQRKQVYNCNRGESCRGVCL